MQITQSSDLPIFLYGSFEAKKIDALMTLHFAGSGYELMCKAGQAALHFIQSTWPEVRSLDILCGTGNNGGDGFVLARLAKAKGYQVTVYQIGFVNEDKLPMEAKSARQAWLEQGEINVFAGQSLTADLVVDALLGIGAQAPLRPEFEDAITAINESHQKVLALDLPSGLNADTGALFGCCVKATATLTFNVLKMGLLSHQGIEKVGDLALDDLDIDVTNFSDIAPMACRLVYADLIVYLPKRRLVSHKGDYGHVCIIGGGESNLSGAVCLAGEAALRAGAGLVTAVVAPESLALLARAPAELMSYGLPSAKDLISIMTRSTVTVLGTGLGKNKWAAHFFQVVMTSTLPKIIDADGLYWLAQFPQKHENWILTPHPKEAAKLLGISTESVQQDRPAAARLLKEKYGGVIVLKGAGTIILDQENKLFLNEGGYPSLAVGGTGDVLAGLIGGLVAQGLSLSNAAKIGVHIHTQAAAIEQSFGTRGMLASDLFLHIRALLNPYVNSPEARLLN